MRAWSIAVAALLLGACTSAAAPEEPEPTVDYCAGDRCDAAQSREALLSEIAEHDDPFAGYLREHVDADGTVDADFRLLGDVAAAALGCAPEDERSFVVLTNDRFYPKAILTPCADDPELASRFLIASPAQAAVMDPDLLHLVAWDETAQRYRRYATQPTEEPGRVKIQASPQFCMDCHGGPRRLPEWQPLMNEMTKPWSQWNAAPVFESNFFEQDLDPEIADSAAYRELLGPELLASASELEPIVRAGIDRFVSVRGDALSQPADLDAALDLLQPAFCDETMNTVSEVHRSGVIRTAAVVDDAFRDLFDAMRQSGPWDWLRGDELRLALPDGQEPVATLVPVRGESTRRVEMTLVNRGALEPLDVVRIRALDYARPVGSAFRCELYDRGRASATDDLLAELPPDATNLDLLPVVYAHLMTWRLPDGAEVSLVREDGIVALESVALDQADATLGGMLPTVDLPALGDRLQARVDQTTRASLLELARTRTCEVALGFQSHPLSPVVTCD